MSEIVKSERRLTKAEVAKQVEANRERDIELVTGIFTYREKPGQKLCFKFKKYAQDPFKKYELEDGKRYRIPRMVAKHLNTNCYYSEYQRLGGPLASTDVYAAGTGNEDTYANMYSLKKIHRTEFRSLEFMDEDLGTKSDIMEITYR